MKEKRKRERMKRSRRKCREGRVREEPSKKSFTSKSMEHEVTISRTFIPSVAHNLPMSVFETVSTQ